MKSILDHKSKSNSTTVKFGSLLFKFLCKVIAKVLNIKDKSSQKDEFICNLCLKRCIFSNKDTIGQLYLNDKFECYTLEDSIMEYKIYGETAIPYGDYEIKIIYSPKFKRKLPLLLDVPGFSEVHISSRNTIHDIEGYILVGQTIDKKTFQLRQSRAAFIQLFAKLQNYKKIYLKIQ